MLLRNDEMNTMNAWFYYYTFGLGMNSLELFFVSMLYKNIKIIIMSLW